MLNHCSCIAVVSKQSEVDEAMRLLHDIGIDSGTLSVIDKDSESSEIDSLLIKSGVPEGSRYCYRCVLETGLILFIVRGDYKLVEIASVQLEQLNEVDISIHLDIPHDDPDDDYSLHHSRSQ